MDPVVMISDFNSATREDIFDGQVLNTTEYAAPEIFYHQLHRTIPMYNRGNDAWSLGVILFNLSVRDYPWDEPPP